MAGQQTMSSQDDNLSTQTYGSPVSLTGLVHGFKINDIFPHQLLLTINVSLNKNANRLHYKKFAVRPVIGKVWDLNPQWAFFVLHSCQMNFIFL